MGGLGGICLGTDNRLIIALREISGDYPKAVSLNSNNLNGDTKGNL